MTILESIFENKTIPFIQDLLNDSKYEVIRCNANYLLSLDEKEFAHDFEYALTKSHLFQIEGKDPFTGKELDDVTELFFLYYLAYYSTKGWAIMEEYLGHCDRLEKPVSEVTKGAYDRFMFIWDFVNLRLDKILPKNELPAIQTSLIELPRPIRKTSKATIEGKPLNLKERYYLLNKLFDLEKKIAPLNISKGKKDCLLGLILDCNTTNARHLMNGKYDAHLRTDAIDNYLQTLKR